MAISREKIITRRKLLKSYGLVIWFASIDCKESVLFTFIYLYILYTYVSIFLSILVRWIGRFLR